MSKRKMYYSLIWMGPINAAWIKKHGSNWVVGRIEVRSGDFDWADVEYGITIDGKDWSALSDFLCKLKTDEILTKNQLCAMFEAETGTTLIHKVYYVKPKSVDNQVRDQVWDQVWDQARGQVRDQVWDQVGVQVRDQVWDQVLRQVLDQVEDQVSHEIG
jgi:hypothetical protein